LSGDNVGDTNDSQNVRDTNNSQAVRDTNDIAIYKAAMVRGMLASDKVIGKRQGRRDEDILLISFSFSSTGSETRWPEDMFLCFCLM
jgi:hypothetical protein